MEGGALPADQHDKMVILLVRCFVATNWGVPCIWIYRCVKQCWHTGAFLAFGNIGKELLAHFPGMRLVHFADFAQRLGNLWHKNGTRPLSKFGTEKSVRAI
jgi:hypothetical protein